MSSGLALQAASVSRSSNVEINLALVATSGENGYNAFSIPSRKEKRARKGLIATRMHLKDYLNSLFHAIQDKSVYAFLHSGTYHYLVIARPV